ncbi:LacI family transcriptional regulator [Lachnospiraceae bacterium ZAX-1]
MVSMKNIAAACNVSVATVSKALNDHKDIGPKTKVAIRQKAKEMGYFPNSSARALRTNRTYNLGILFADEANSGLTHDYFASVINSFKNAAEEEGYDITFLNNKKTSKAKMSYLEHCWYRGFEGVVIACIDFRAPQILELVNSSLPLVTIDHLFHNKVAVMSNNADGMRDLVTYIYGQGHRKIAYIHGADSAVTGSRVASFFETMEQKGVRVKDEYIKEAEYRDAVAAGKRTEELIDLQIPPTCIIYPDDFSAMGGMNVLKTRGLRIPEDISIAGYDGITIVSQLEPRLTTIAQDTNAIGRKAAEKLIGLIEKPKSTRVEIITVDGKLVCGNSVGKI